MAPFFYHNGVAGCYEWICAGPLSSALLCLDNVVVFETRLDGDGSSAIPPTSPPLLHSTTATRGCAVILHNCASDYKLYTNCARCLVQV